MNMNINENEHIIKVNIIANHRPDTNITIQSYAYTHGKVPHLLNHMFIESQTSHRF